jgi:hypothetical protein
MSKLIESCLAFLLLKKIVLMTCKLMNNTLSHFLVVFLCGPCVWEGSRYRLPQACTPTPSGFSQAESEIM